MKRSRSAIAALVGAVLVVPLASCAPADDSTSLVWWATQQTGSTADSVAAWEAVAERYTEKTGVEVEVEVIPWADLYNKILTAVSSGTGPDVLNIGTTWTASLHDTGALSEVSGENLAAMGGDERFVSSAWEATQIDGSSQTAVPLVSNVYSLYYNTALFEASGVTEPPTTWEDFVELGKKLTLDTDGDGNTDQWGFAGQGAALTANSHMAFILGGQEGGAFVDADGNPTLSSDAQQEGFSRYLDLMGGAGIMSPADAEVDLAADTVDQLINGQAAMMLHQNPVEQFESRNFTDWAIAEVPVIAGGENVQSMVAGSNITVFQDSTHQKEAFELVGHVTSAEEQAFLADAFKMLPVVSEAYELAPFSANGDATVEIRRSILAEASAPFPLVPNIGEIEQAAGDVLRLGFQAYATQGNFDLGDALKNADEQLG